MTTDHAMRIRGQHQTSITVRELIEAGGQITKLWTNGEPGDAGVSIVQFDHGATYIVDNGSCTRYMAGYTVAVEDHGKGE